ncbi:MAG: hypothetical protein ABI665_25590, partial [Vicinamibacterales bacterium]
MSWKTRAATMFKTCLDCRAGERVFSAAMSTCFFLVISTFWILKPLKKTAFIGQFDEAGVNLLSWHVSASEAELVAKILNMVVAFAAVVVFTWLARRYQRQWLVHIFSVFFIACFIASPSSHGASRPRRRAARAARPGPRRRSRSRRGSSCHLPDGGES